MWLTERFRQMFVATGTADFRRSYDGLSAMVEGFCPGGSMSGNLFAFFNRRRTQVKMLFWDGTGYWIFMKRLEAGSFRVAYSEADGGHVEITNAQLAMLLEGIDAQSVKFRKRFGRNKLLKKV